jgi:hypothetical protein
MLRRAFLAGAAGLAASGALGYADRLRPLGQIDVHHHVFPPPMQEALRGKIPDRLRTGYC